MKVLAKKIIKENFGDTAFEKLTQAKRCFIQGLKYLSSPTSELAGSSKIIPLSLAEVSHFSNLYINIKDEKQRELFKASVMERIIFNKHTVSLLETEYAKSLFKEDDLFQCSLAAAHYANGNIQKAYDLFHSMVKREPTPFDYLCLSRCAIHTSAGDGETIKVLEEGLRLFPTDFSLNLSMAGAYFRLNKTEAANTYLNSIDNTLRKIRKIRSDVGMIDELESELTNAMQRKLIERPKVSYGKVGDFYSEGPIKDYWHRLFEAFNGMTRYQHGWPNLCCLTQEIIAKHLTTINPKITSVINFGVFCAEADYRLAKQFPSVRFMGVDRDQVIKTLNDKAYKAPNLSFVQSQIIDVLENLPKIQNPALLFHARTATLLYPEFLKKIYRACAKTGIRYITLYENFSLSRSTLRLHDFDGMPQDSIPYMSVMFIHNYKKYLEEAGYRILESQRLPYADLLWHKNPELLADSHITLIAELKSK